MWGIDCVLPLFPLPSTPSPDFSDIWTEHKCVNNVCVGDVNWPLVFVSTIVALLILVILFGMLYIAFCHPW